MSQPKNENLFSHRADPDVPAFEDAGPVVFMDGECALCSTGARIISRLDKLEEFRICPIQNAVGQGVLTHYGLDPTDPDSWLYLVDGRAYTSIDAMIRVGRRLGGIGHATGVLSLLPRAAQDRLYRCIARNRYQLLGHARLCSFPDPQLHRRLIG